MAFSLKHGTAPWQTTNVQAPHSSLGFHWHGELYYLDQALLTISAHCLHEKLPSNSVIVRVVFAHMFVTSYLQ